MLATSAIVTIALAWFGWRTAAQEQHLELQRKRELLENAADTASAGVRAKLAEAREKLGRAEAVDGAIVVTLIDGKLKVLPPGSLPFVPAVENSKPKEEPFVQAERLEFAEGSSEQALGLYERLSADSNAAIRAGALLRLGRTLRKLGREQAATETYKALSKMGNVSAGGFPAELAGWDGQKRFQQIADGIDHGKWLLSRGAAEFYRERATDGPKPASWLLAEALSQVWGKEVLWMSEEGKLRALAMWRLSANGSAGLVADADAFVKPLMPAGYGFALLTNGKRTEGVARTLGDAANPWLLQLSFAGGATSGFGSSLLIGMLAMVMLFLWATTYFMARAIQREAEAAQLQSDFVASVSHEFRSPLTTVRQLAEMLEMGQVPNDERRQKYYQVLTSESRRLQRLVETLLNFGKLESGVHQFSFERVSVAGLVQQALSEAEGSGRVVVRSESSLEVTGDKEALTVAVRNLIENALKYSPDMKPVEVHFGSRDGRGFLDVKDYGAGIPIDEQKRVFEKFVRGRSAAAGNIKGTGIGLAMVKQIMLAHGGEVRLNSEPARGATFTLLWNESR